MKFIVATNVIASRPPERRPTGTPHARTNNRILQVAVEPSPLPTTEIENTQHVAVQPIVGEHLPTMNDGLVDMDNMMGGNDDLSSDVGAAPSV